MELYVELYVKMHATCALNSKEMKDQVSVEAANKITRHDITQLCNSSMFRRLLVHVCFFFL